MIYSMTGYGRAGAVRGGREITVELRSVNARFLEYSDRLPRSCAFLPANAKTAPAAAGTVRLPDQTGWDLFS